MVEHRAIDTDERLAQARGLRFKYPHGPQAVDGVDLDVAPGELVCLLGPNGSGKSTILRLIAGLLTPDEGTVEIGGRPSNQLSSRERAHKIAWVPQELRALPEIRVDHFVLGGRYARLGAWARTKGVTDKAAIESALAATHTLEFRERHLTELSGGQRQRVLIARALAQESPLLLVDEPTSSLDPEHRIEIFELLARLTCEGRGLLVVTHDLNLASQFATRIVLLQEGRARAVGTPEEILTPEVLEPVYGPRLRYGRLSGPDEGSERPFVLPWRTR